MAADADLLLALQHAVLPGEPKIIRYAYLGQIDFIQQLVEEQNTDVDTPSNNEDGPNALAWAVSRGHTEVVTYLLDQGADIETTCTYNGIPNMTPFLIAAQNNDAAMLKLLASRGALFNVVGGDSGIMVDEEDEPEYEDAGSGEENDEAQQENNAEFEAIDIIIPGTEARRVIEAITRLHNLAQGVDSHEPYQTLYEAMFACVQQGASPNQRFEDDNFDTHSLLHIAVDAGQEAAIEPLLTLNPDLLETVNSHKMTPLMFAASDGNVHIIRRLVQNGAKLYKETRSGVVPVSDDAGKTCLMLAMDHLDALKCLIEECGVSVNEKNKDKLTPLMVAAKAGNMEFIKYLFEECPEKPKVQEVDLEERNALMHAIRNERDEDRLYEIVQYLINQGANLEDMDSQERTPLDMAKKRKYKSVSKLIKANEQLLDFARGVSTEKTLPELLAAGANLSVRGIEEDVSGVQPIHIAAMLGQGKIVRQLLEVGASPSSKDDEGYNAVYYALLKHKADIVILCLLYPLVKMQQENKLQNESFKRAVTPTLESAFAFVAKVSDTHFRGALYFELGSFLRDELTLMPPAEEAFKQALTCRNPLEAHVEDAGIALAEMALADQTENTDPRRGSLEMEDEPPESSEERRLSEAASFRLQANTFQSMRQEISTFDKHLFANLAGAGFNEGFSAIPTTPAGAVQMAQEYGRLRRKSVELSQENQQLKTLLLKREQDLKKERIARAQAEATLAQNQNLKQNPSGDLQFSLSNQGSTLNSSSLSLGGVKDKNKDKGKDKDKDQDIDMVPRRG